MKEKKRAEKAEDELEDVQRETAAWRRSMATELQEKNKEIAALKAIDKTERKKLAEDKKKFFVYRTAREERMNKQQQAACAEVEKLKIAWAHDVGLQRKELDTTKKQIAKAQTELVSRQQGVQKLLAQGKAALQEVADEQKELELKAAKQQSDEYELQDREKTNETSVRIIESKACALKLYHLDQIDDLQAQLRTMEKVHSDTTVL
jgi:hypothetical protein